MTLQPFLSAFDALPDGQFLASANGQRYFVVKETKGRRQKLIADALGFKERFSLNIYRLSSGAVLKPCERPADQVISFVQALKPD